MDVLFFIVPLAVLVFGSYYIKQKSKQDD